ncbi:hypothetical protein [Halobacillus litoralis]|uniref:hypothetical protein n=1 Tax=Halobacillus litoralis TaxID=45668 RepID=UPI001CD2E2A7|nr:hypothetical protein [Halobacillus litoralis]MCA1024277.1 hypothetical protein [Halobacillus litoralis]
MGILEIILTSGVTTVIVAAVLPFVGKKLVDNYFKEKLEDHKHDLQLLSKKVDFDYQRHIHDFNLFSNKKHEIYAEVYSQLVTAKNELSSATSAYRQYPDFWRYDSEKVREFLNDIGVNDENEINRITSRFELDKQSTVKELTVEVDAKNLYKADLVRVEATRYLSKTELYLSETVSKKADEIVQSFKELVLNEELLIEYKDSGEGNDLNVQKEQFDKNKQLKEKLVDLKGIMQKEISVGYYTDEESTDN